MIRRNAIIFVFFCVCTCKLNAPPTRVMESYGLQKFLSLIVLVIRFIFFTLRLWLCLGLGWVHFGTCLWQLWRLQVREDAGFPCTDFFWLLFFFIFLESMVVGREAQRAQSNVQMFILSYYGLELCLIDAFLRTNHT